MKPPDTSMNSPSDRLRAMRSRLSKTAMIRALGLVQDQISSLTCDLTPHNTDLTLEDLKEYVYDDDTDIYYPFRPDSISERIRNAIGIELEVPIVNMDTVILGSGEEILVDEVDGYTYDALENTNNYVTNVILRGDTR